MTEFIPAKQTVIFLANPLAIDSLSPDDPELQNIVIKKLYDFIKASSKMQHLVKQIKLEESARAGNN
jgi:hypothetical protein